METKNTTVKILVLKPQTDRQTSRMIFNRMKGAVSTPPIARVGAFFSIFRDLQSPLSGRKKSASTFLPPEKKEHLEDFTAEEVVRARKGKKKDMVNLGSTLGQPSVNPRSTLGQPWVSSLAISGRFWAFLSGFSIRPEKSC